MNRSATESPTSPTPSMEVAMSVVILLTIGILGGTVGNARVCFLLRRWHGPCKVPHFLLASLSLTGLLSSLLKMPVHLAVTIVTYFPVHQVSLEIVCKTGFSSAMGSSVLNALTLSLMAIDRYDCVVRPLNRRLSVFNVKKVILATWIVALLSSSFHGVTLRNENSVCFRLDPYSPPITASESHAVAVATSILGILPNVATLIIVVVTIFRVVRKLRSTLFPPLVSLSRRRQDEITKLTYKICAVFLISWFPIIICNTVARIGGFHGTTIRTVGLFAVVISNFNYVVNPILHYKMLQVRLPDGVRLTSVIRHHTASRLEARMETTAF